MDINDRRYEQLHKTQAQLAMSECVNAMYIYSRALCQRAERKIKMEEVREKERERDRELAKGGIVKHPSVG